MEKQEEDREGRCLYYKDYGECSCNNDPDDLGECVYGNGYKPPKAQIECRYFAIN